MSIVVAGTMKDRVSKWGIARARSFSVATARRKRGVPEKPSEQISRMQSCPITPSLLVSIGEQEEDTNPELDLAQLTPPSPNDEEPDPPLPNDEASQSTDDKYPIEEDPINLKQEEYAQNSGAGSSDTESMQTAAEQVELAELAAKKAAEELESMRQRFAAEEAERQKAWQQLQDDMAKQLAEQESEHEAKLREAREAAAVKVEELQRRVTDAQSEQAELLNVIEIASAKHKKEISEKKFHLDETEAERQRIDLSLRKAMRERAAAKEASRAEKERMAVESETAIKAVQDRLAAEEAKNQDALQKLKAAAAQHADQLQQKEAEHTAKVLAARETAATEVKQLEVDMAKVEHKRSEALSAMESASAAQALELAQKQSRLEEAEAERQRLQSAMQEALKEKIATQEASRAEKERMAVESETAIRAVQDQLAAEEAKNNQTLRRLQAAAAEHAEQLEQEEAKYAEKSRTSRESAAVEVKQLKLRLAEEESQRLELLDSVEAASVAQQEALAHKQSRLEEAEAERQRLESAMRQALDEKIATQDASRAEKERLAVESKTAIKAAQDRLATEAAKGEEKLRQIAADAAEQLGAAAKHLKQLQLEREKIQSEVQVIAEQKAKLEFEHQRRESSWQKQRIDMLASREKAESRSEELYTQVRELHEQAENTQSKAQMFERKHAILESLLERKEAEWLVQKNKLQAKAYMQEAEKVKVAEMLRLLDPSLPNEGDFDMQDLAHKVIAHRDKGLEMEATHQQREKQWNAQKNALIGEHEQQLHEAQLQQQEVVRELEEQVRVNSLREAESRGEYQEMQKELREKANQLANAEIEQREASSELQQALQKQNALVAEHTEQEHATARELERLKQALANEEASRVEILRSATAAAAKHAATLSEQEAHMSKLQAERERMDLKLEKLMVEQRVDLELQQLMNERQLQAKTARQKEQDWLPRDMVAIYTAADDDDIEDEIQRRLNESLPETPIAEASRGRVGSPQQVDISGFLVSDAAEADSESAFEEGQPGEWPEGAESFAPPASDSADSFAQQDFDEMSPVRPSPPIDYGTASRVAALSERESFQELNEHKIIQHDENVSTPSAPGDTDQLGDTGFSTVAANESAAPEFDGESALTPQPEASTQLNAKKDTEQYPAPGEPDVADEEARSTDTEQSLPIDSISSPFVRAALRRKIKQRQDSERPLSLASSMRTLAIAPLDPSPSMGTGDAAQNLSSEVMAQIEDGGNMPSHVAVEPAGSEPLAAVDYATDSSWGESDLEIAYTSAPLRPKVLRRIRLAQNAAHKQQHHAAAARIQSIVRMRRAVQSTRARAQRDAIERFKEQMRAKRKLDTVANNVTETVPASPLTDKNRQLEATNYMLREMQLAAMHFCDRVNRVVESHRPRLLGEYTAALFACISFSSQF